VRILKVGISRVMRKEYATAFTAVPATGEARYACWNCAGEKSFQRRTSFTSKKGGGEIFAPARSCIRKRRNDGRLTGARTSADDASFALGTLAGQLANATNGFGLLTRTLLRRLFVKVAHLHFTENTFALHLLLESAESLINVVIADKYLHENPVPLFVASPNEHSSRANI
jgi:hypothetical protein